MSKLSARERLELQTRELISAYQHSQGEERYKASDALVSLHLGLVKDSAKRYVRRGEFPTFNDLIQIGSIGLIKSFAKFDLEKGVMFSSFATTYIHGEIKKELRHGNLVHYPFQLPDDLSKVKKAQKKVMDEKGREAALVEIVAETGLSLDRIQGALGFSPYVESLDELLEGMADPRLDGLLEVPVVNAIEKADCKVGGLLRDVEAKGIISKEEREVLSLILGVDGERPIEVEQVPAYMTGLSKRPTTVKKKGLSKLRELVETENIWMIG